MYTVLACWSKVNTEKLFPKINLAKKNEQQKRRRNCKVAILDITNKEVLFLFIRDFSLVSLVNHSGVSI